jgi:uncharacterized protein YbaP (TraB family)
MKKTGLSIVFFIIISGSAYAETSLWRIQNDSSTLYLGGTIHVLRSSDYPLPKEFHKAYEDAAAVIFETDLGKFNRLETQQILMSKGMYKDGLSLKKVLSSQAYNYLKKYCDEAGIPIASLNQLKPPIIVLMLLALELKKIGIDHKGIDLYFYQKATADGKKKAGLETVDKQIEFITSMGEGNENDFIVHSIRDLHKTRQIITRLIDGWKEGNVKLLSELFLEQLKTDFPALFKTLVVDRNRAWLPKIEAYLQTPQKELVLVGVGHLVGEDGIIQDLKKRGYKVKKFRFP